MNLDRYNISNMKNDQQKFKSKNESIFQQYIVMALVWIVIVVGLTVYLVMFIAEKHSVMSQEGLLQLNFNGGGTYSANQVLEMLSRGTSLDGGYVLSTTDVNDCYAALNTIIFPLIDFSTWGFLGMAASGSPETIWSNRMSNIDTVYAYVFISTIIGYIALVLYFVVIGQVYSKTRLIKKMNLTGAYPSFLNNYRLFNTKTYLEFIVVLSAFFAFFSLVSTLVFIVYIIFIFSFYTYAEKHNKGLDPNLMAFKKKDIKYFYYLIGIMLFQNGYTLLCTLLLTYFEVNIRLVLDVFFSFGTLAVMIAAFVKSILATTVTAVSKGMKTVGNQITNFRIFFNIHKNDSLKDYGFVQQTPPWIKKPLANGEIDIKEANKRLGLLNETTDFYQSSISKAYEKNFMLYRLYNQISSIDEVNDTIENIKRTNVYYQAHPKKKLKLK